MSRRRPPRVCLVLCPGWSFWTPALGPALLKPFLKSRGYAVETLDLGPLFLKQAPSDVAQAGILPLTLSLRDGRFVAAWLLRAGRTTDEAVRRILQKDPDVVGFTAYATTWHMSALLAERLKREKPGLSIVFGGPEATRLFDLEGAPMKGQRDLAAIDAVVPGEGELALLELLDRWSEGRFAPCAGAYVKRDGRFVQAGALPGVPDLDALPFPDFGQVDFADYGGKGLLTTYFNRGCYKKCVFCDVESFWGGWRTRSGARVAEEVEYLAGRHPGLRGFLIGDPLVNANMKELGAFCREVRDRREAGRLPEFSWQGYAVVRPDMTREVIGQLRESGCEELWFGIESGSQRVVNAMKKGYRVPVAEDNLRECCRAGIRTLVLLMAGFPTETPEDFEQTLEFVRRNAANISRISAIGPVYMDNQSPMHRQAQDYRIDPDRFHMMFWRTRDGKNDFEERIRRMVALRRCAEQEGVPIEMHDTDDSLRVYRRWQEAGSGA